MSDVGMKPTIQPEAVLAAVHTEIADQVRRESVLAIFNRAYWGPATAAAHVWVGDKGVATGGNIPSAEASAWLTLCCMEYTYIQRHRVTTGVPGRSLR